MHSDDDKDALFWIDAAKDLGHQLTLLTDSRTDLSRYDNGSNSKIEIQRVEVPECKGFFSCLKTVGCYRTAILRKLMEDAPVFGYHKFSFISPAVNKAFEGLSYLTGVEIPYCVEISDKEHERFKGSRFSYFRRFFFRHVQYVTYAKSSGIICSERLKFELMEKYKVKEDKIIVSDSCSNDDSVGKVKEIESIIEKLKEKF